MSEEIPYFPMVTLCGSVRFREDFEREAARLSLEGHIVLMPCVWDHDTFHDSNNQRMLDKKTMLDRLHLRKILHSKFVFVINRDGYIGMSTGREIAFAMAHGIPVYYLEKRPKYLASEIKLNDMDIIG